MEGDARKGKKSIALYFIWLDTPSLAANSLKST